MKIPPHTFEQIAGIENSALTKDKMKIEKHGGFWEILYHKDKLEEEPIWKFLLQARKALDRICYECSCEWKKTFRKRKATDFSELKIG